MVCTMTLRFSLIHLFLLLPYFTLSAGSGYSRADFPEGFVFGSGTSAYQYEGAAFEDGRSISIWDTFTRSGKTGGPTGDITCDGYHKYEEDINLMADMGLEAFRFSIAWARLIPNGRGPLNPLGLQFYNNFIDKLISRGIQPHAVLFHLDLPQILEDQYGGWRNTRILEDFTAYADVCFREFGDRVKFWTTINEANIFSMGGYSSGLVPPGRCSPLLRAGCVGNSSTEAYIVGRNVLLAHSAAWRLYQDKYKETQKGQVGFNIYGYGAISFDHTEENLRATKRYNEFYIAWLMDPLIYGDYPKTMKEGVRERLPALTKEESNKIKGSFDFIALNHYITILVKQTQNVERNVKTWSFDDDVGADITYIDFTPASPYEFPPLPSGLSSLLEYIKQRFGNPPIYIHENGAKTRRNGTLSDISRINYFDAYIGAVLDSIRNGTNIKGYFTWTLLDCLELLDGYNSGFGFYFVDLDDPNLPRYPKLSSYWYSDFMKGKRPTESSPF